MKRKLAAVFCGVFGLVTAVLLFLPAWARFQLGDNISDSLMIGPLSVSASLQGKTEAVMGPHDATGFFGLLLIASVLVAAGLMIAISAKSLRLKSAAKQDRRDLKEKSPGRRWYSNDNFFY